MNQRRSSRSVAALAAAILIAVACNGSSTGPSHDVAVRTTEPSYRIPPAGTHLTIEATVSNSMNETLLLDGIGRDFRWLEKRVGLSWKLAYMPIYILPLVPDIEVPAGETRQLTFHLYVSPGPNSPPMFEYDIPGVYRAVFGFRVGGNGFEVYSNEFELRQGE